MATLQSNPPLSSAARGLEEIKVRYHLVVAPAKRPAVTARRELPWVALIVLLGLGFRAYHFFRNPPVWHDEAALITNVLNKQWSEILGPLYYSEACPPLFLALMKIVTAVLGDGPFALRLVPFLASCLALIALVAIARRILGKVECRWFALLLGCSNSLLWHACEAKPYSMDVLIATGLLALTCFGATGRKADGGDVRLILACCIALTPVLVFLSFPACFLLGGIALVCGAAVWNDRRTSTRILHGTFVAVLCGSFLTLYYTAINAQKDELLLDCWSEQFPSWNAPWRVPLEALWHMLDAVRYAFYPGGQVAASLAVVGGGVLWRQGRGRLVALLIAPIGLNLLAWLACGYPLNASRVVAYSIPALLLLISAGITPVCQWLRQRHRFGPVLLLCLLFLPIVQAPWRMLKPWTRLDSRTPAEFVLAHRAAEEPVAGVVWEQRYYFRGLGSLYRALGQQPTGPPTLPPATAIGADGCPSALSVPSLWLVTFPDPHIQEAHVAELHPGGPWRIVERHFFRDFAVLRVRQDKPVGGNGP
jgi:hypothetical protein